MRSRSRGGRGSVLSRLKIIGLEEHLWTPGIRDRLTALPYSDTGLLSTDDITRRLDDVGEQRLRDMDAMGVDVQVLSVTTPATQVLEPGESVRLAREANDVIAQVIADNPGRFGGFATLPTPDPGAAAEELRRSVQELGLRGAMWHGRTGDKMIDHPDFAAIFDAAAELGVPIHLHPQRPAEAISDSYYGAGLPEMVGRFFSTMAWGWHMETAVNVIRLILGETFERAPGLQLILGHWGEMIPFFLERIEEMFGLVSADLGGRFASAFAQNVHLAPAGMWSYPMLQHAIAEVGADRIVFSIDYPFLLPLDGQARRFLELAPISETDKHKIGHLNAERLLGL